MFEQKIKHATTFSRSVNNMAKAGAYYTDKGHCRRIGWLIDWPDDEVCVLEPSCGDTSALMEVISEASREQLKLFGIEINSETYDNVCSLGTLDYVLNADFLNGVKISSKAFSFMFANPPYGEYENGMRYEQAFLEKSFSYLKKEALIVYVIPYYLFKDDRFCRSFFSRFNPKAVYRFDDTEYAKWQQVVIFAYKRKSMGYVGENLKEWLKEISVLEHIPYLPVDKSKVAEKFKVGVSKDCNIQTFSTLIFNAESFLPIINKSFLFEKVGDNCGEVYNAVTAGSPPLPLSKENSYMLSVCGAGSGLAGDEDKGTLHLQRGVVENIEVDEIRENEKGKSKVYSTLRATTSLHILDSEFNYCCFSENGTKS